MELAKPESADRRRKMSGNLSSELWNQTVISQYSPGDEKCRDVIFNQYKLYVEMADKVSARRDTANAFFLALNSIVLSAGPTIIDKGYTFESKWLFLFPYVVLCMVLFFWWRLISSYKQLNGAKFIIVGALEEMLPARPYGKAEWEFMLKSGKDKKVYWPLSHIESALPWIFFVGYTIALLAVVFCK